MATEKDSPMSEFPVNTVLEFYDGKWRQPRPEVPRAFHIGGGAWKTEGLGPMTDTIATTVYGISPVVDDDPNAVYAIGCFYPRIAIIDDAYIDAD